MYPEARANCSKAFLLNTCVSANGQLVVCVGGLDSWDPFVKGIVT